MQKTRFEQYEKGARHLHLACYIAKEAKITNVMRNMIVYQGRNYFYHRPHCQTVEMN